MIHAATLLLRIAVSLTLEDFLLHSEIAERVQFEYAVVGGDVSFHVTMNDNTEVLDAPAQLLQSELGTKGYLRYRWWGNQFRLDILSDDLVLVRSVVCDGQAVVDTGDGLLWDYAYLEKRYHPFLTWPRELEQAMWPLDIVNCYLFPMTGRILDFDWYEAYFTSRVMQESKGHTTYSIFTAHSIFNGLVEDEYCYKVTLDDNHAFMVLEKKEMFEKRPIGWECVFSEPVLLESTVWLPLKGTLTYHMESNDSWEIQLNLDADTTHIFMQEAPEDFSENFEIAYREDRPVIAIPAALQPVIREYQHVPEVVYVLGDFHYKLIENHYNKIIHISMALIPAMILLFFGRYFLKKRRKEKASKKYE